MDSFLSSNYIVRSQPPRIKLDWNFLVNLCITAWSRLANTLETIFTRILHNAIGQNWVNVSTSSAFGSRQITTLFTVSGIVPLSKASFTNYTIDTPTMFQKRWKKLGGYLSGPGSLSDPIWKTALLTSSDVISLFIHDLSECDNVGNCQSFGLPFPHPSALYNFL